ncbi:MAG: Verru_Chthon cassette protein D [Cupriavidus sp.]|nr:MAG: Verru_Chthon cassette protein D [Cupriavidus sp.]
MKAFSLIELLTVIAILAILAVVAIPAVQSIEVAQSLNRGASLVEDQFALARQTAIARNRGIEVRLVELSDTSGTGIRGIQLWIESEDGSTLSAFSRLESLPSTTIISQNPALSPLLTAEPERAGSAVFSAQGQRNYRAFRIRPSGSLDSLVNTTNNFLTICTPRDVSAPPQNYATLRINPVTGRVTQYRP